MLGVFLLVLPFRYSGLWFNYYLTHAKIELIKVRVEVANFKTFPKSFVDIEVLNLVTEMQILAHEKEDDL